MLTETAEAACLSGLTLLLGWEGTVRLGLRKTERGRGVKDSIVSRLR